MRFDKNNDPYEALNDPALLDDTPIGTLRVVTWGRAASVAIMRDDDPTIVKSIIHTLHRGENPLNAIYGKRTHEQDAVKALYDRRDDTRNETERRADDDLSRDFVSALDTFERRNDEGAEAMIGFAGHGHVEVRRDS